MHSRHGKISLKQNKKQIHMVVKSIVAQNERNKRRKVASRYFFLYCTSLNIDKYYEVNFNKLKG